MAVGKRGSFATVNPNQVLDLSEQVNKGFETDIKLQDKEAKLKKERQKIKQGISDSLVAPEFKATDQKTIDNINYEVVGQLRDRVAETKLQFQNGKMSISEMRARTANLNRTLDNYSQQQERLRPAIENFTTLAGEDKLSRGLGDGLAEDGIAMKFLNGNIKNQRVDEAGRVLLSIENEKGELKEYDYATLINYLENPPVKYEEDTAVSTFAKEFVSVVNTQVGASASPEERKEANLSYYETLTTKGLSDLQKSEIKREAVSAVNSPDYQNDIWYQYTLEKNGEGEVGKVEFTDDEKSAMQEWLSNQMIEEVRNRMINEISSKYNFSDARADINARNKGNDEETPKPIIQVPDKNDYLSQDSAGWLNEQDGESIKNGTEVALNSPLEFSKIRVKAKDGKESSRQDVFVQAITKGEDGDYYIRGYQETDKGGTISEGLGGGGSGNTFVVGAGTEALAKMTEKEKEEWKKQRESTTKKPTRVSVAFKIDDNDVSILLSNAGITEDAFGVEKKENKPKFN